MKLPGWKAFITAALLVGSASMAGCEKKNSEEFSYAGTWATVKVMNMDVSTPQNADAAIVKLTDAFLKTIAAEQVKQFAKEAITEMVDLARGIKIEVKKEGNACRMSFAGLGDGVNGTWQVRNGDLVLNLNEIPVQTLDALKADASIKGKINYSFAASISGKEIAFSRIDGGNNIKYELDTQTFYNAIGEYLKSKKILLPIDSLMPLLNISKVINIEFHKVS